MHDNRGLTPIHGILAFLLAMLFLLFGGSLLIPLFGRVGAYLAGLVIALIALAFTAAMKTKPASVFPVTAPPVRQFCAGVLLYVGVLMFNGCYSMLVSPLFPESTRDAAIDSFIASVHPLFAILLVAVLPALCEEFFCRGFLSRTFRDLGGDTFVIIVTAVMFGCMHLDLYSLIPTTVMGLLFGFLAIKTKSLLLPILLHFFNNALSVLFIHTDLSKLGSDTLLNELNLGARLSLAVFYGAMCVMCVFYGLRLFRGKKAFLRPGVKVLIILLVILNIANILAAVFSMRVVVIDFETVTYEEGLRFVRKISVEEEGEYRFYFEGDSHSEFRVILRQGEEMTVYETHFAKEQLISETVTLAVGEYEMIVLTKDKVSGTLTYTMFIVNEGSVLAEAMA